MAIIWIKMSNITPLLEFKFVFYALELTILEGFLLTGTLLSVKSTTKIHFVPLTSTIYNGYDE